jgi:transcription termination/antitermination protein NusG
LAEPAIVGYEELRGATGGNLRRWYAIWTNSHCEQLVCDQLRAKGFEPFLPRLNVWSRRGGERRVISVPMFSGYLFLHHSPMDDASYIEVCKTRGLARVLGERWDRAAVVPDREIEAIQRVLKTHVPVTPYPYLTSGQRVRILGGPLADVEGILVRLKPNRGLVVLCVDLVQQSIAVEVDCTLVTPV